MRGVPFDRSAIDRYRNQSDWVAELQEILERVVAHCSLTLGDRLEGGVAGAVFLAKTAEGGQAVLKIGFPHPEAVWEPVGLDAFGPDLAPRILGQDPANWAILLERVSPGASLSHAGVTADDALRIGGGLARMIAERPRPRRIPRLDDAVAVDVRTARSRRAAQAPALKEFAVSGLVDRAIDLLDALARHPVRPVLLHGDLNPGNILSSEGGGWRVIDPKPLVGDAAYDLWPLVTQLGSVLEAPNPAAVLATQLVVAAEVARVDPQRAGAWAFARSGLSLTWAVDDGDLEAAQREANLLRAWAEATSA
jgi:streptomycin 6-kinase